MSLYINTGVLNLYCTEKKLTHSLFLRKYEAFRDWSEHTLRTSWEFLSWLKACWVRLQSLQFHIQIRKEIYHILQNCTFFNKKLLACVKRFVRNDWKSVMDWVYGLCASYSDPQYWTREKTWCGFSFSAPFRSFSSITTRHPRISACCFFISSQAAYNVPEKHQNKTPSAQQPETSQLINKVFI